MTGSAFRHETHPDWGLGLVLEDREGKWVLLFEQGGRKVFQARAKGLVLVPLDSDELESLQAKVHGKHAPPKSGKPKPKN